MIVCLEKNLLDYKEAKKWLVKKTDEWIIRSNLIEYYTGINHYTIIQSALYIYIKGHSNENINIKR